MYHNDYVIAVRQYLMRYTEFSTYVLNLRADIEDLEAKLPLSAVPKVPVLSASGGCGGGEISSQQERIYVEKEAIPEKIIALRGELAQIEPLMNRLNRSLEALTEGDRLLITERFIDNSSWILVASDLHTSIGYCRKRSSKVLEILAGMMFGPGSIPVQTHFVFYEEKWSEHYYKLR